MQVTTAMQGSWVVSSSDDGSVRIFDQRSGAIMKCLRHADGASFPISLSFCVQSTACFVVDTLVQVVAVSEICIVIPF